MRVRMAILTARRQVDLREIVLRAKPIEMLVISPKGTVPVLQLHDGKVLEQSLDIMHWALPHTSLSTWQEGRIACNDTQFKAALDRYKYAERHPEFPASHYFEQGLSFLQSLDGCLVGQSALQGGELGFCDWAILPFVRQFAGVDPQSFRDHAPVAVQRWLGEWIQSPAFAVIMHKYPAWQSGDVRVHAWP